MHCDYFAAGVCRSCTLMTIQYAAQLTDLDARVRACLAGVIGEEAWEATALGPESGFRNKAKLVVGGERGAPTLGILDGAGRGVDLRRCGLYEPGLAAALDPLAGFVAEAGLTPYDVPARTGELKHLVVTHSPDDELMVRFVLRSPGQVGRLTRQLPELSTRLPQVRVVTANLLPEHKAVLEGDVETVLSADDTLPMRLADLTLHLGPRSFFQTNTVVAQQLYRTAAAWTADLDASSIWDLYCGVGGFALHCHRPGRATTGVELSSEAVASARHSARSLGHADAVRFEAGDAAAYAIERGAQGAPDLVVVNPPRRGIGPELADWLETSRAPYLLYSSCNPTTLAADLARMPSLRPVRARIFDMFPQSPHAEVLVLARRVTTPAGTD
ncbi:MAG TPA: methyltransferase domain-containing protein [Dermatophilaceae bacterium]|nr:methyltransferase domain-containing protein [Dermatophilaceae bacterium]